MLNALCTIDYQRTLREKKKWTPLEVELNRAKDQLEKVDFAALHAADPYERQIQSLKSQLSHGQHVTKAWLKMYELLTATSLGNYLLGLPSPIRVVFNAELPGGFVYAVNHFLKSHGKGLEFVISSFWPRAQPGRSPAEVGDFLGDQFGLLKAHPEASLIGVVKTNQGSFWSDGDLTNPRVPRS